MSLAMQLFLFGVAFVCGGVLGFNIGFKAGASLVERTTNMMLERLVDAGKLFFYSEAQKRWVGNERAIKQGIAARQVKKDE